jgi:hypothetical protein
VTDFYRKATPSTDFYGSVTASSEPNMREELENTLDGSFPEVAKATSGVFRKMRRDSDGVLIPCDCVDLITQEPDRDRFCPICFGDAYLWDESDVEYYRVQEDSDVDNALRDKLSPAGLINVALVVFYIRYSVDITTDDKIVEVELELDGSRSQPARRKAVYRIGAAYDYRADNGKLEYWKVFAYQEKVKYLNAPTFGDL